MADLDLVIVGGGPAGLTAGLYAARANMNAVLFDAKGFGGEILNTDLIEDYPGFASIAGRELAEKMAEHATKFGLRMEIRGITKIRRAGDEQIIELDNGATISALAVIIAAGGVPVKLDVPGEIEFHGRGVSYCAVCDGAFFKGADLAVIGGGDSAFQEALFLTRFAKKIYLVHRRSEYRAQAILQDRLLGMEMVSAVSPATVKQIGGDRDVKWIEIERGGALEKVPVEGVFIFVGFTPLGRELFDEHIQHDKTGYIITDQDMRTNLPGIYAVGDCRAQLARQVTTAVGDATTAVLHAERYIEELKHARTTFKDAPRELLAASASQMELLHFAPGAIIICEGDAADRFYVVKDGEVVVTRRGADGAEDEVNRIGAGGWFGEVGLLTGAPRNATVRAVGSVALLGLDVDTFGALVRSSQGLEFMKTASKRM